VLALIIALIEFALELRKAEELRKAQEAKK